MSVRGGVRVLVRGLVADVGVVGRVSQLGWCGLPGSGGVVVGGGGVFGVGGCSPCTTRDERDPVRKHYVDGYVLRG